MSDQYPLVFDGHNDVLSALLELGYTDAVQHFVDGSDLHIDLPKAGRGGFAGGLFAIWVPSPSSDQSLQMSIDNPPYCIPLPEPVAQLDALPQALAQAALLLKLHDCGALQICTSVSQIRHCMAQNTIAAVMHMEGAEPLDAELQVLEVLYGAGLRSLGPVWSRANAFGEGVPFVFPGTPDIGGGLTPRGIELIRFCSQRNILIDLSHINQAGFDDVARYSDMPLVATHSNAHGLCAHSRNLTDRQLAQIADSNGLVGLNFATAFLSDDGHMRSGTGVDEMLRQLDYLLEHLGEHRVAFGSDFDGASVPDVIQDASGLSRLRCAMRAHGYDDDLMRRICHENWLRVLELIWGE